MRAFAKLMSALASTGSTTEKVELISDHLRTQPPADAAWAIEVLLGARRRRAISAPALRRAIAEGSALPDWLVAECHAVAGDLAETAALLCGGRHAVGDDDAPPLPLRPAQATLFDHLANSGMSGTPGVTDSPEVVDLGSPDEGDLPLSHWMEHRILPLSTIDEPSRRAALVRWWSRLDAEQAFVLTKLITGSLRIGVARGLVERAIAAHANVDPTVIAARLMRGWSPTPAALTALVAPATDEDESSEIAPRPFFLASPLEEASAVDGPAPRDQPIGAWIVEWKFDGIRAQLVRHDGETAIWLRGGDLASERFPEIVRDAARLPGSCRLDGEIVAWRADRPSGFLTLQRRINRLTPSSALLRDAPVAFIAYDLLALRGDDLRDRPIESRLELLAEIVLEEATLSRTGVDEAGAGGAERVGAGERMSRIRRSTDLTPGSWEDAVTLRAAATSHGHEGLMLKRRGSPYRAGRKRGDWWKWKVDPYTVDAVLIAAEPGHGRRAGLHSDCTFALRDGDRLVPFAKAYSGLTDIELVELDRWVRRHTTARHGPVRSVEPLLVFEIAFERVARSSRHASGLAVRFPRILRWRRDKAPSEADQLSALPTPDH